MEDDDFIFRVTGEVALKNYSPSPVRPTGPKAVSRIVADLGAAFAYRPCVMTKQLSDLNPIIRQVTHV